MASGTDIFFFPIFLTFSFFWLWVYMAQDTDMVFLHITDTLIYAAGDVENIKQKKKCINLSFSVHLIR